MSCIKIHLDFTPDEGIQVSLKLVSTLDDFLSNIKELIVKKTESQLKERDLSILQKYREFNQVFNYIFSKKFAQNMFKCQTGESTNTLAKKMIKPFLPYGWNTQEINTIFANMKKNPDGHRFDFMTHRL